MGENDSFIFLGDQKVFFLDKSYVYIGPKGRSGEFSQSLVLGGIRENSEAHIYVMASEYSN